MPKPTPLTRREVQAHRDSLDSEHTEPNADAPTAEAEAADAKREKAERIGRTAAVFIMPLLIVGMMVTGYLSTMASPTAEDMPVVVAGSESEAADVAAALREAEPEALEVDVIEGAHTARQMVYDREAAAAIAVDSTDVTFYTASGAGTQQLGTVADLVGPVLSDQGLSVSTEDLAPLPDSDPTGLGAMFFTLGLVMAGYLPFSVLRSNSPELLKFRRIVPLIAAWAAVIATIVWTVTGPILGVIDLENTAAVLGLAWLGVFAIASVQLFFVRLLGPMAVLFGLLFLMVLGMPSSNMAVSIHTMPAFFQFLHEILPMPAIGEAMRSILYFGGAGVTGHLFVLAVGAVAGLVATMGFDYLQHRKNPNPVPLGVNIPSLHGGRRPDSKVVRYISLACFPLAMVAMLVTTMLGAMHSPEPREMPVAVVGSSSEQAEETITGLEEQMGENFDLTALTDEDEARTLVEDRAIVAALILPTEDNPEFELVANQAANASAFQAVEQVFTQVAAAQDMDLVVDDQAPLPDRDANGVVALYLSIGWILAGFLVVIVGANANPATRPLQRMLPLTAAYSALMSAILWLIAAPITGAIEGNFLSFWGAGIVAIFCVAMFAMVLERLIGMFSIIPVIGILMFAGVPSSDGALSQYMTPGLFTTLNDYLPMAASVETIRSILYFEGDAAVENLQILGIWGLTGLALVIVIDSLKRVRTEHDFSTLDLAEGADSQRANDQHDTTATDAEVSADEEEASKTPANGRQYATV